jgi:glycogen synthase
MKVLMTADAVGGVWTYALELAAALAPHDAQVTLAVMGPPPSPAQRAAAASVPNVALLEGEYRLEWMDDPWDDVARAGGWLLRLEEELRPDVVHVNGYAHGALPWRAPALVAAHSCVLSWWLAVKGEPAPPAWARYQREVMRGLAGVSLVVAPTRAMLADVEAHYGTHAAVANGMVVPNGRRADRYRPGPKEPFVLSAGRIWDEAKNVATLARAAGRLPWPVYVAGDGTSPDGSTVGGAVLDTVRSLGRLSDGAMADWLGRAAIFALPARYEPFGLSALEAALAGCALVLGDTPSLREVWGDAATFVPPNDADALAAAITALAASPARRGEMAGRARGRALAYTSERMAAGYLAAYARVAARPLVPA